MRRRKTFDENDATLDIRTSADFGDAARQTEETAEVQEAAAPKEDVVEAVIVEDAAPETDAQKAVKADAKKKLQTELERRRGRYTSVFEQELLARRGQAAPPKRSFEAELAARRRFNR